MNHKVVLSWIAAGLLAYIAGISGNAGIIAFCSVVSLTLFIVGCTEINTYGNEEKLNVDIHVSQSDTLFKKQFKIGDTVKMVKATYTDKRFLNKTGKIICAGNTFDWFVNFDGEKEPLNENQLELVTPKKARRSTITHSSMTKKQKRAIYNARWAAKKKLKK